MPTANRGLPYPALSNIPDVPADIQALATALDPAAFWNSGTIAARPTSGQKKGDIYWATDDITMGPNGTVYFWDHINSQWRIFGHQNDAIGSVASARTLGTGATQATAGNDARLSNARTPVAHGNSHQMGVGDALVPGSFGELAAHDEFVAGVVHDSDFMPTINAGGTRVFNGNLGKAAMYIQETTSGFLIRHLLATSTIIGHPANASGNPRVDQVVASYAGPGGQAPNFQVLQGNPTAGAQITNPNAANYRAGALALPAGYVRISDGLIAAGAPANTVSVLVDRRPFCRGARVIQMKTNGAIAVNPGVAQVAIDAATLQARIECTGRPIKITLQTNVALDTADFIATGLFMDGLPYLGGAAPQDIVSVNAPGPGARNPSYTVSFTPAAGSHLFTPTHRCTNAGATGYSLSGTATKPTIFIVEEDLRDSQANGIV